jgi:hypothetical protein
VQPDATAMAKRFDARKKDTHFCKVIESIALFKSSGFPDRNEAFKTENVPSIGLKSGE